MPSRWFPIQQWPRNTVWVGEYGRKNKSFLAHAFKFPCRIRVTKYGGHLKHMREACSNLH